MLTIERRHVGNDELKRAIEPLQKHQTATDAAVKNIRKNLSNLSAGSVHLPEQVVVEYGSVILSAHEKGHWKQITFRNRYARPPVVLASESGTSGGWVAEVKAEAITKTGAKVAVAGRPKKYNCRVGYIVIGKLDESN